MRRATLRQTKRKLSSIQWYKQSAATKFFYMMFPWVTAHQPTIQHKPAGVTFRGIMCGIQDGFTCWYWPPAVMRRVGQMFWQREQKQHGFTQQLFRHWLNHDAEVIAQALRELNSTAWKDFSDTGLWANFRKFAAAYNRCWREAIFIDAFDLESDPLLDAALNKEKQMLAPEDIAALLTPTQPSWMAREQRSLLFLVTLARQSTALRRALVQKRSIEEMQARFPRFMKKIGQHTQTYSWSRSDYAIVQRRTLNGFLAEVRALLHHPEHEAAERKALRAITITLRRKKTLLSRGRISPATRLVVNFLATCSSWRDERKAVSQMANDVLHHYLKEFSRRTGRTVNDMESSNYWELGSPDLVRAIPKDIQQRKKFWFSSGDPRNSNNIFIGQPARELRAIIEWQIGNRTALRGRSAVAGVVRGRARIIMNQRDFSRFRRGDILVAPNTRPEYVPIMKLASAIVTEEGGVTSHAAIVSRELNTPAIVGVQGATTALRDGDRVEVDATKGLVRKL